VERYKDTQEDPLIGKPFQELHDMETLDPTPEWKGLYEATISEINQEFGLTIDF
jgi:hypothetical protein